MFIVALGMYNRKLLQNDTFGWILKHVFWVAVVMSCVDMKTRN